ncbi:MAG: hypothetical protein QOD60_1143, partial [Solirubrobacterales bacterium]|nr:hypothetical protein [Solirubrobacterales bacterium]
MTGLTERVSAWRWGGAEAEFRGQKLHTFHAGGAEPLL